MIRKQLLFLLTTCTLFACSSNDKNKSGEAEEVIYDTVVSRESSPDSAKIIVNKPLIWTVTQENSGTEKLEKPQDVRLDTLSANGLVQLINNNFPDIHINFSKISHDTIFVQIPDSKVLTQQMGSTGAENFMASTTYTLTELKTVKYVNIAMKEGDHASPGTYSREDFKHLR